MDLNCWNSEQKDSAKWSIPLEEHLKEVERIGSQICENYLVWSDEFDLKMNNELFLGAEKYQLLLENIYAGLGIPPSAVGDLTSQASCQAMEYMLKSESGVVNNYLYGDGRSIGGDKV